MLTAIQFDDEPFSRCAKIYYIITNCVLISKMYIV